MVMPGAEAFERAGLKAWPGIEVAWDGSWIRRASNGYTKRANSVQSLDASDDAEAEVRIAAASEWFLARGLQPVFRVTPLAGPGIIEVLDDAGWRSVDASHLFAMPLEDSEPDPRGELYEMLDRRFIAAQQHLSGLSDEQVARMEALLSVIAVPARGVVLRSADGEPLASALMAVADGIVITGNVVTSKAHRRQGHGAALMRTGHTWASSAGATIAALNVQGDNSAGKALYRSLGYSHQYDYIYRVPA